MDSKVLIPLVLSLKISFIVTLLCLLFGVPAAWVLARMKFPGKRIIDSLITLPVFLPPSVMGYYLLIVLGRNGPLGKILDRYLGVSLIFTWQAAVIAAFVMAAPLLVKSAKAAFEGIDPDIEDAARTLGKSERQIFFTITLPLGGRGLVTGTVMAFARSLGEFGATLMVAGNIPEKTQTMPVAIYDAVLAGNNGLANTLVIIMTIAALLVLWALQMFGDTVPGRRDDA